MTAVNTHRRVIADLLNASRVGDLITYAAISDAIGRRIQECRFLLADAIAISNRETGALFSCRRGDGYIRIPTAEAHAIGSVTRRRIRRQSRRASASIQRAVSIVNDMPEDAKRRAYQEIAMLGLINHMSRDAIVRKASGDNPAPSVSETARATIGAMMG